MKEPLIFLKLGGSLITDKDRPRTVRAEVLARLAAEIVAALAQKPGTRLLLGHGSGSFGHVEGRKYGTRAGVETPDQWRGFAEVWSVAAALNRHVMDALRNAGLPALAFPPSAGVVARDGQVARYEVAAIEAVLARGLVPVVYGDVALDEVRGGTILSTEDIFAHLAKRLRPSHILLAGIEAGVYADYPRGRTLVTEVTLENFTQFRDGLLGSASIDVTGGMLSKVTQMLELAQALPGLVVRIFSGLEPGTVLNALLYPDAPNGTRLLAR